MTEDFGHWRITEPPPENAYGFVYLITNTINNKKYIGKKQLKFKKVRRPLKGKKNKRRSEVESDWKTYTGSSKELNADIEKYGKDKFIFEILEYCYSKAELSYKEAKIQFERDVLLREDYYNGIVNLRVGRKGLSQLRENKIKSE